MADDELRITLFGLVLRRIPYWHIEEVYAGSHGLVGEVWTLLRFTGLLTIKKKRGLFKYVTIAPYDRDHFAQQLRHKILSRPRN